MTTHAPLADLAHRTAADCLVRPYDAETIIAAALDATLERAIAAVRTASGPRKARHFRR